MKRNSGCGGPWAIVATVAMSVCAAAPAPAFGADDPAVALGQKLYTQYCASCHGPDGKGNGPAGAKLDPKPSDLTQIAKKNGGKFPFYETMLLISGRDPQGQNQDTDLPGLAGVPKAHGDPKMPVWGEVFSREELSKGTSLDLQMATTGKIMLITEYLQSIQAK
jgi:mono/diheme cytochrome c family protein